MNQKIIVKVINEHVLVICLPAIMEIVYHEFISVMVIMIVWIIPMKMNNDINVTPDNVTQNVNSPVRQIKTGVEPNVYRNDGFVMVIQIVWMVPMRIQHYIIVHHPKHVMLINLDAIIIVVLVKNGFVVCCNLIVNSCKLFIN